MTQLILIFDPVPSHQSPVPSSAPTPDTSDELVSEVCGALERNGGGAEFGAVELVGADFGAVRNSSPQSQTAETV